MGYGVGQPTGQTGVGSTANSTGQTQQAGYGGKGGGYSSQPQQSAATQMMPNAGASYFDSAEFKAMTPEQQQAYYQRRVGPQGPMGPQQAGYGGKGGGYSSQPQQAAPQTLAQPSQSSTAQPPAQPTMPPPAQPMTQPVFGPTVFGYNMQRLAKRIDPSANLPPPRQATAQPEPQPQPEAPPADTQQAGYGGKGGGFGQLPQDTFDFYNQGPGYGPFGGGYGPFGGGYGPFGGGYDPYGDYGYDPYQQYREYSSPYESDFAPPESSKDTEKTAINNPYEEQIKSMQAQFEKQLSELRDLYSQGRAAPAQQTTTAPAEEFYAEPAEEVVTKPVEEVVTKPAQEVVTKPAEESYAEPVEEVITPAEQTTGGLESLADRGQTTFAPEEQQTFGGIDTLVDRGQTTAPEDIDTLTDTGEAITPLPGDTDYMYSPTESEVEQQAKEQAKIDARNKQLAQVYKTGITGADINKYFGDILNIDAGATVDSKGNIVVRNPKNPKEAITIPKNTYVDENGNLIKADGTKLNVPTSYLAGTADKAKFSAGIQYGDSVDDVKEYFAKAQGMAVTDKAKIDTKGQVILEGGTKIPAGSYVDSSGKLRAPSGAIVPINPKDAPTYKDDTALAALDKVTPKGGYQAYTAPTTPSSKTYDAAIKLQKAEMDTAKKALDAATASGSQKAIAEAQKRYDAQKADYDTVVSDKNAFTKAAADAAAKAEADKQKARQEEIDKKNAEAKAKAASAKQARQKEKAEEEAKAKAAAEVRKKQQAEAAAKAKAKAEEEAKAKAEAEAKKKAAAEAKKKADAEAAANRPAKIEAREKAQAEEQKARAEAITKAKAAAEAKKKAEADARAKALADAEAKRKAVAEAKKKADAEAAAKKKAEQEARAAKRKTTAKAHGGIIHGGMTNRLKRMLGDK